MRTVIVVGGGISGLTAGVYAAASGYRTVVLERAEVPGGVCTAWDRRPYTFDGCVHWLLGTGEGDRMRSLYQEIGALDHVTLAPIGTFARLVDLRSGTELAFGRDLDALLAQVEALSPDDVPAFRDLVDAARSMSGVDLAPGAGEDWTDSLSRVWEMRGFPALFARFGEGAASWVRRLRHPGLRACLGPWAEQDLSMALLAVQLGQLAGGRMSALRSVPGHPGPSRAFARGIADRLAALGGTLRTNADVDEILVEDDRAVGVRLLDGEELRADHVIAAAPLHTTVFRLLGGRYVGRALEHRFATWRLFDPIAVVHVGCSRTWDVPPGDASLRNVRPFTVLGQTHHHLGVRSFADDPLLAPPGHTVLQATVGASWDRWSELHHTPRPYLRAKAALADGVLGALEARFPGVRDAAAIVDVATPYTWWRYTRAWRGAYEGWWPSGAAMAASFDRTLPGLAGLWLTGQWLRPGGGLPPAVADGRAVVRALCAHDRVPFRGPTDPADAPVAPPPVTTLAEWGEGLAGALRMIAAFATPFLHDERSHWGLSAEEAAGAWVGDDAVPEPRWSWTHAVEVAAPASAAWPWVVQLGQGRGGFYSYEALENLIGCAVDNADHVLPDAQHLALGDPFRLHPDQPPLRVTALAPGRSFVVSARGSADGAEVPPGAPLPPDGFAVSWAFVVEPRGDDRCRVVSRFRIRYPPGWASALALGPALLEPVGFVMDRKMLLGIRERVEAAHPRRA
jgi:phytoene desaturase